MEHRIGEWLAASFFLVIFFAAGVSGQIMEDLSPSNLGGRDSVSGTVYLPDRRTAGRGLVVKLNKGGNDATSWTDPDGKFIFSGVGNGTYSLTIEAGDEFEPATQRFEITQARNTQPQTHFVNIQLRWRPNAQPKRAVVDAELARASKKAQEHYQNGRAAGAKGDHQGAVNELLKAVEEFPEFSLAHTELGVQYQKLNQLEKADEHLAAALKIKPDAYEPLANRGVVLVRLKRYDEAETAIRAAMKIKDESPVAHFYLGRALAALKRADDAIGEFRIALLMGGASMNEARRAIANIYLQRGDNQKAVSELEAYLAANPSPADEKQLRDTLQQARLLAKEKPKP